MSFLISLLHSRGGALVQWLAGVIIGWLTSQAVRFGLDVPAAEWARLEEALCLIGAFLITVAVQWYQAKKASELQEVVGAKKDSWIGPETIAAAKALLTVFKKP